MGAKYTGPKGSGVNLERCTDTQEHLLGQIVEGVTALGHPAKYMYVKFEDAVTYVAGHFVNVGAGETGFEVTNDISNAMAGYVGVGLVFQETVPTEGQYGWVQCAGIGTALIGSSAVIAGDALKNDGTTDGALDEATRGGTDEIVAVALATIADTATGLVRLTIAGVG